MALMTVEKGPLTGRVCYAILKGRRRFVTVEVAVDQCAFRFVEDLDRPLREGDWVKFEGKARVQNLSRKGEPEELERILYYHPPYDGSDVREWTYFDLNEASCSRIGPLDVMDALTDAVTQASSHIDDWFGNHSRDKIARTCRAMSHARAVMEAEMRRCAEPEAPVLTQDIEV